MLNLVITLLIIALVAAVLGFGGIAGAAIGLAKIIFFVALVLLILSLLFGRFRRPLWSGRYGDGARCGMRRPALTRRSDRARSAPARAG